jgi:DnaJ family protein C protein 28
MLTRDTPPAQLPVLQARLTRAGTGALRDAGWAAREAGYHAHAVGELNALVRKYNGLAPATVRRGYYSVDAELDRAYDAAADEVLEGLRARVAGEEGGLGERTEREGDEVREWDGAWVGIPSLSDMWRGWLGRLFKNKA